MESTWKICVCFYCCLPWLSTGTQCSPPSQGWGGSDKAPGLVAAAADHVAELHPVLQLPTSARRGYALLPPLLKVLSDRGQRGWASEVPRLQPDSRALRYMKRLYKMSATKEGIPKAHRGHLYNTVRLFTPCSECRHRHGDLGKGDLHSVDLLFNLDRVTALEHLLKSVLLYSFDTSVPVSSSITCICHLSIKEHDFSSQVCPSISHSLAFSLHFEVRKRKWVEVDVTPFLQPLIATHRRNIHMAVNFTCLMGDPQQSTKLENPVNVALVPPSLLLYLNDTSEQAYHRWNSLRHGRKSPARGRQRSSPSGGKGSASRASRQRRDENLKAAPAAPPNNLSEYFKQFLFPQNECELHNFRLSFSQLKWDRWIIAPHRYSPQYCKGDCPRATGHRYGSAVHTVVQNLISERLDPAVPRPSCVPAAYSPLSVLTIEPDGSIVYKEYEDMIATRCTCR
ncbi:PREDICTED: growth/differentiation factor 9 [Acanthisitta chloris]|uniref:Growth/differentiation factor 9 n=1 Tax=Acanthisitta chloris TaxID=57068 RepID=A0A091MHX3_9PASS|nr:PREDICTED: growth/differentiation factor 9 [Acanthisitta chloris]KFP74795.1 Growth/differentiation factor 9 [Acanthisitta chloris]